MESTVDGHAREIGQRSLLALLHSGRGVNWIGGLDLG